MTSVKELHEKKGTGNWWSVDDIIGKEITILEDIGYESDLREDKKGAKVMYYCILCRMGTEDKDVHFTAASLKVIGDILPHEGSWLGYCIKHTGKKGSGMTMEHLIEYTGRNENIAQGVKDYKRLDTFPSPPAPQASQMPPTETTTHGEIATANRLDLVAKAIKEVVGYVGPIKETGLAPLCQKELEKVGTITEGEELDFFVKVMKSSGRVVWDSKQGGYWVP